MPGHLAKWSKPRAGRGVPLWRTSPGLPLRIVPRQVSGSPWWCGGTRAPGRHGEEEFVFFAAVEGLFERCAGESGRVRDFGGGSGREAEAVEVEREAVADVDRGGGVEGFADVAA